MKWFYVAVVLTQSDAGEWQVDITPSGVPQITPQFAATLAECERDRQRWTGEWLGKSVFLATIAMGEGRGGMAARINCAGAGGH
jgi:hypothetical protein